MIAAAPTWVTASLAVLLTLLVLVLVVGFVVAAEDPPTHHRRRATAYRRPSMSRSCSLRGPAVTVRRDLRAAAVYLLVLVLAAVVAVAALVHGGWWLLALLACALVALAAVVGLADTFPRVPRLPNGNRALGKPWSNASIEAAHENSGPLTGWLRARAASVEQEKQP